MSVKSVPCPICGGPTRHELVEDNDPRGRYLGDSYWCEQCREIFEIVVEYVETEPIKEDR